MNKIRYNKFKDKYYNRFVKYYVECSNDIQRKELKRSIFDNINLTIDEKEMFWGEVVVGGKNVKSKIAKSARFYKRKSK